MTLLRPAALIAFLGLPLGPFLAEADAAPLRAGSSAQRTKPAASTVLRAGLEARAEGRAIDDQVAALVDLATAGSDAADRAAAALLLLDRNDAAFEILETTRRAAPATRPAGRPVAVGNLNDAVDAVAGQAIGAARQHLHALWPARIAEAEVAWHWLGRQTPPVPADEALVRIAAVLDPAATSSDAEAVLADGMSLLSGVSACHDSRIGAGLVRLAQLRGDRDGAVALAREWSARSESADAWGTLANLLRQRELWAGAADAFHRAADRRPDEGAARWMEAAMLSRLGDDAGAAEARERALLAARAQCAAMRLAGAMEATGDHEAAARAWAAQRRRVAAAPLVASQALHVALSAQAADLQWMVASGRLDDALALGEHAIEPFVSRLDATADLVAALRADDRTTEAEALLARVSERVARSVEERPDGVRELNSRAWLAARTGSDLAAGLVAAERAAELAPTDPGILDTLAEVRFQLGDREAALEAARRALALEPTRSYLRAQVERIATGDPSSRPPLELD